MDSISVEISKGSSQLQFCLDAECSVPQNSPQTADVELKEYASFVLHARSQRSVHRGQTVPVSVRIGITSPSHEIEEVCRTSKSVRFSFEFKAIGSDAGILASASQSVVLRCRDLRRETFLASVMTRDGAVVNAAVKVPIGGADTVVPTVISLHGTGVSAANQADSYKRAATKTEMSQQRNSGEYVFGIENAWLITPDRHGAHNWETLGYLTALDCLFYVAWASATTPSLDAPRADSMRVLYAGHSMGGHGALFLATHSPDRAIGCMILAGWITKEHYGEANALFKLDHSTSYTDSRLKGLLESAVNDNNPDLLLDHVLHVPIFIRVGANDNTVSAYFSRRLFRLLRERGHADTTYEEVANQEHWWWDTEKSNDGGCVNDGKVRDFFTQVLNGGRRTSRPSKWSLATVSPRSNGCLGGLCVLQQVAVQMLSKVQLLSTSPLMLKTSNVQCLSVDFSRLGIPQDQCSSGAAVDTSSCDEAPRFEIDGQLVGAGGNGVFCKNDQRKWAFSPSPVKKAPGPMRLYTEGGPLSVGVMSANLEPFAMYFANLHWIAYDTPVEFKDCSSARVCLSVGTMKLELGKETMNMTQDNGISKFSFQSVNHSGRNLALATLIPQRDGSVGLRLHGSTIAALEHLLYDIGQPTIPPMMRAPFTNQHPSIILSDADERHRGAGAVLLAGFFTDEWRLSPSACYSADGSC